MTAQEQQPYLNTREDSPLQFLGLPTWLRSTGQTTRGAFGLVEQSMPPGFASPYHTHHLEDEAFYVLEGEISFVCGGKWLAAGPGAFVYGPREIPHGFQVEGPAPARMLLICTPAGFEQFVVEMSEPAADPLSPPSPPDMAKLAAVAAKYQVELHGPLPERQRANGGIKTSTADGGTSKQGTVAADPTGHKELNLRWIEAFNQRDWPLEASFRSAGFQAFLSGSKEPLNADGWAGFMASITAAFPDAHISLDTAIAEGDTVASRWTIRGTHRGEFQGMPPTGNAFAAPGIDFSRIADGRVAEHWAQFDMMSLLQQIGAMPG